MPTSAAGNSPGLRLKSRGFTLIELMVVVALVAIAAGVVSVALNDGGEARLEREAVRLSALLETARAEARASGLAVRWVLTPDSSERQFRFVGLPQARELPTRWLDDAVRAQIGDGHGALVLGPEPLIGAQRVLLRLDRRSIEVSTDGLQPFGPGPVQGQP